MPRSISGVAFQLVREACETNTGDTNECMVPATVGHLAKWTVFPIKNLPLCLTHTHSYHSVTTGIDEQLYHSLHVNTFSNSDSDMELNSHIYNPQVQKQSLLWTNTFRVLTWGVRK